MKTCSIEGCDKKAIGRGWCSNHYARWRRGGDPLLKRGRWDGHVKQAHPCDAPGCDRMVFKKRLCSMHAKRRRRHGDTETVLRRGRKPQPIEERFAAKTHREGACLVWTGSCDKLGYGKFSALGQTLAHRAAWCLVHGSIPAGMWVLHRCDNPSCVAIEHLFLGDHQANMDDMNRKGRARHLRGDEHGARRHPESVRRGERNGFARLTADQVSEIRARYRAGESQATIAEDFAVHQATISKIVLRKVWAHIP